MANSIRALSNPTGRDPCDWAQVASVACGHPRNRGCLDGTTSTGKRTESVSWSRRSSTTQVEHHAGRAPRRSSTTQVEGFATIRFPPSFVRSWTRRLRSLAIRANSSSPFRSVALTYHAAANAAMGRKSANLRTEIPWLLRRGGVSGLASLVH
jgi:hypothetical protein